jgi:signal transduction histidine kinase
MMDMIDTKQKKWKMPSRSAMVVALLTVAVVISGFVFYQVLETELFQERQSHFTALTAEISETLDTIVESAMSKTSTVQLLLEEEEELSDETNLQPTLERIATIADLKGCFFFAVDSSGMMYSADSGNFRWPDVADLNWRSESDGSYSAIREVTLSGEEHVCMVFFRKLSAPVPLGTEGDRITHAAVAVPLDIEMSEELSIDAFGEDCFTYLVDQGGRRLFKQTYSRSFITEYEVLTALSDCRFFGGGTLEDLRQAVANRGVCCMEFFSKWDGVNYFVSSVPVAHSDWSVLMFVPSSVLSAGTGGFTIYVVLYMLTIAAVILVICALLLRAMAARKFDQEQLVQQQQSNASLMQAAERAKNAAEEAQNANAAKSKFLSNMSHDIRTPINGIVGMTNIAMKSIDGEKRDYDRVKDCLQKITGSANHLLSLINDVLDMSHIESGKVEIAHVPIDMRSIVDNCASIISGQLLTRHLTFEQDFQGLDHPYLFGDELHLRQVLINILGNAVKYTPDGGTITFRVREEYLGADKVLYRFVCEDNGIGMSEEFQTRIFEAFSQEEGGSRTTYKGTGLGMAITKQFVDLMGGSIKVESKLNEGSRFTVELTFDIDPEYHEKAETQEHVQLAGMRVLLVEDNDLNVEIAQEMLEDEEMVVDTAANGQIAVEMFTSAPAGTYDVILMDVMMPVMNGYEATRAIRASDHPEGTTIPIIAMTANAYTEDVQAALDAGMDAHVAKPIDFGRLFAVLNQYDRKKHSGVGS